MISFGVNTMKESLIPVVVCISSYRDGDDDDDVNRTIVRLCINMHV